MRCGSHDTLAQTAVQACDSWFYYSQYKTLLTVGCVCWTEDRSGNISSLTYLSTDVYYNLIILRVKKAYRDLNITSFIPSGRTGYVQALDVAINKPLNDKIGESADIS